MTRISPISWKKFDKFLLKIGCELKREEGDHRIYIKADLLRPIVIPRTELPIFIIKNNLRTLGISNEKYLKLLSDI